MGKTKIEWTATKNPDGTITQGRVWNPVVGCTPVSAGCAHCYAKRIHDRFYQDKPFSQVQMHPERLEDPWHWKKPSRVFVNSMSDLFHEDVPDEFIHSVFSVMATAENQTFLILTKRPERMKKFCSKFGRSFATDEYSGPRNEFLQPWPLPNVWLGVTAENQRAADERIPLLLETPAAVRFVSVEPMLGPVDLENYMHLTGEELIEIHDAESYSQVTQDEIKRSFPKLDWVICGGETGPGARPMHQDWARSLRDQCQAAEVPFFFKSWGDWLPYDQAAEQQKSIHSRLAWQIAGDKSSMETSNWFHCGKKVAGRLLNGEEWNQFPEEGK